MLQVLTNIRLIIENIKKYVRHQFFLPRVCHTIFSQGVIVPLRFNTALSDFDYKSWPNLGTVASLPMFALSLLGFEKLCFALAKRRIRHLSLVVTLIRFTEFALIVALLFLPVKVWCFDFALVFLILNA